MLTSRTAPSSPATHARSSTDCRYQDSVGLPELEVVLDLSIQRFNLKIYHLVKNDDTKSIYPPPTMRDSEHDNHSNVEESSIISTGSALRGVEHQDVVLLVDRILAGLNCSSGHRL